MFMNLTSLILLAYIIACIHWHLVLNKRRIFCDQVVIVWHRLVGYAKDTWWYHLLQKKMHCACAQRKSGNVASTVLSQVPRLMAFCAPMIFSSKFRLEVYYLFCNKSQYIILLFKNTGLLFLNATKNVLYLYLS